MDVKLLMETTRAELREQLEKQRAQMREVEREIQAIDTALSVLNGKREVRSRNRNSPVRGVGTRILTRQFVHDSPDEREITQSEVTDWIMEHYPDMKRLSVAASVSGSLKLLAERGVIRRVDGGGGYKTPRVYVRARSRDARKGEA